MGDRMKSFRGILGIFLAVISWTAVSGAGEFRVGMDVGRNSGAGAQIRISAADFARNLPVRLRLNAGYFMRDPGNAITARKIFINNNQGGTIEKHGRLYLITLDILIPVRFRRLRDAYLVVSPAYSSFRGNFKYIGNNEDFDVTSRQWGLGLSLEKQFIINRRMNFLLTTGAAYFPGATLYGHDTSYSPNGEYNNPRENYTYQDADRAINQPRLEWRLTLGMSYRLGKMR